MPRKVDVVHTVLITRATDVAESLQSQEAQTPLHTWLTGLRGLTSIRLPHASGKLPSSMLLPKRKMSSYINTDVSSQVLH